MATKKITVEALRDFVRKEAPKYLQQPNVTSVGVGYKRVGGKPTKELSIQFTVAEKLSRLEDLQAIGETPLPESVTVAGVVVPTDVLERSYDTEFREISIDAKLEAASPRKVAVDPIVPGVSIGHPGISAGTVGCVVYDAQTGAPYALSNWHILCGPSGIIGDPIVQPGKHDDNRVDRNVVGKLVRSHLGLAGDCAIASIDARRLSTEIVDLGVAVDRIGEPELGDKVVKSGRTTDVTYGVVARVHVITKLSYGAADLHEIGCFEIGPDPDRPAKNGEISMGGDSGSAWLAVDRGKPSTIMLGLHFAGEADDAPEHALACYPGAVFEKLEIRPTRIASIREDAAGLGYAPGFLGQSIPAPQAANETVRADMLEVRGKTVFDYVHFSLAMSQERRFARWVAWNVDGSAHRKLSRSGIAFKKDPRIPARAQVGDELYANNELDRGHIARRADLVWGPLPEARRANVDSFFFTNIAPQHSAFNQSSAGGIWGALENAIFADVEVEELRISVMGGPIFSESDPEYRRTRLPKQFWKIICFRQSGADALSVKAFVLTQADLLNELEALELPEFTVYEVSVARVSDMTGLLLPAPSAPEPVRRSRRSKRRHSAAAEDAQTAVRRIGSIAEIVR